VLFLLHKFEQLLKVDMLVFVQVVVEHLIKLVVELVVVLLMQKYQKFVDLIILELFELNLIGLNNFVELVVELDQSLL
jgi:hypothetical protein